jgi:hypothetical protein
MSRENAATKSRRLLAEGRLRVLAVDLENWSARGECRGDSGAIYDVGRDRGAGWFCSCPAQSRCSHVFALELVVAFAEPRRQA